MLRYTRKQLRSSLPSTPLDELIAVERQHGSEAFYACESYLSLRRGEKFAESINTERRGKRET